MYIIFNSIRFESNNVKIDNSDWSLLSTGRPSLSLTSWLKHYEKLKKQYPDAWLPDQFANPDNIEAHELELGAEIVDEFGENVDGGMAGIHGIQGIG